MPPTIGAKINNKTMPRVKRAIGFWVSNTKSQVPVQSASRLLIVIYVRQDV